MVSRDWLEKDFYKVMGVAKDAPTSDIKRAYRHMARDLHPDHNPGNAEAEKRFKEVSEAYSVLSDDKKRKEYDETRSLLGAGAFRRAAHMGEGGASFDFDDLMAQARAGAGGFGGQSGGIGDLFGSFFGGPRRRDKRGVGVHRRRQRHHVAVETAITGRVRQLRRQRSKTRDRASNLSDVYGRRGPHGQPGRVQSVRTLSRLRCGWHDRSGKMRRV